MRACALAAGRPVRVSRSRSRGRTGPKSVAATYSTAASQREYCSGASRTLRRNGMPNSFRDDVTAAIRFGAAEGMTWKYSRSRASTALRTEFGVAQRRIVAGRGEGEFLRQPDPGPGRRSAVRRPRPWRTRERRAPAARPCGREAPRRCEPRSATPPSSSRSPHSLPRAPRRRPSRSEARRGAPPPAEGSALRGSRTTRRARAPRRRPGRRGPRPAAASGSGAGPRGGRTMPTIPTAGPSSRPAHRPPAPGRGSPRDLGEGKAEQMDRSFRRPSKHVEAQLQRKTGSGVEGRLGLGPFERDLHEADGRELDGAPQRRPCPSRASAELSTYPRQKARIAGCIASSGCRACCGAWPSLLPSNTDIDQSQTWRYSPRTAPRSMWGSPLRASSQSTSAIRVRRPAPARGNATQLLGRRSPWMIATSSVESCRSASRSHNSGEPWSRRRSSTPASLMPKTRLSDGGFGGTPIPSVSRGAGIRRGSRVGRVEQAERASEGAREQWREASTGVVGGEVRRVSDELADQRAPRVVKGDRRWHIRGEPRFCFDQLA